MDQLPERARSLPDFVIIGASKCGTTALITNLSQHPDVYAPTLGGSFELNFFNKNWSRGLGWYQSLFNRPDKLQGEKTPSYLSNRLCIHKMAAIIPQAKLIITVRNPVDRAYSYWNHFNFSESFQERENWRPMPFADAIRQPVGPMTGALFGGFYARYIRNVFKIYRREQIHVIISERLRRNTEVEYSKLLRFLNLRDAPQPFQNKHERSYTEPLDPKLRATLNRYFIEPNSELRELLNDPIPEWEIL